MTPTASSAAADYARAVRDALADLAPDQMHAILDGLDEHLAEVAADGATDLAEALGPAPAYAAELRSAAGLPSFMPPSVPAGAPEELPEVVSDSVAVADESADRLVFEPPAVEATASVVDVEDVDATADRQRWVRQARIGVGLVVALLAIVVIRASEPINGLEVALGAAAVGAAWWALRWLTRRADLPAGVASRMPLVLGAAAGLFAVMVGAELAGSSREIVYVYEDPTATVLPSMDGAIVVPDVTGLMALDAEQLLHSAGLAVVFVADDGDGIPGVEVLDRVVVWVDPMPNSVVMPGVVVRLGLGPVAMNTVTTIVPAPTTALDAIATTTAVPTTTTIEPDATPVPTTTLPSQITTTAVPNPSTTTG